MTHNGTDDDLIASRRESFDEEPGRRPRWEQEFDPPAPSRRWDDYDDYDYDYGGDDRRSVTRPVEIGRAGANVPAQWKNRRRMAWIALISIIAVTGLCIFYIPLDRLDALGDIIMWFFVTMGSVIGAYMGFTTWWATRAPTNKPRR